MGFYYGRISLIISVVWKDPSSFQWNAYNISNFSNFLWFLALLAPRMSMKSHEIKLDREKQASFWKKTLLSKQVSDWDIECLVDWVSEWITKWLSEWRTNKLIKVLHSYKIYWAANFRKTGRKETLFICEAGKYYLMADIITQLLLSLCSLELSYT